MRRQWPGKIRNRKQRPRLVDRALAIRRRDLVLLVCYCRLIFALSLPDFT